MAGGTVRKTVGVLNGVVTFSAPKDHQRRSVPYPPFMHDALLEQVRARGLDEPLFATSRGGHQRYRNVRRDWFDAAAHEAGLEGLTPHELRHTAASLALAGATVLAVQRMLRHDKPSTTLDVCSDLFDEDLGAVAERLGNTWAETAAYPLCTGDEKPPVFAVPQQRLPGASPVPPRRFERPTPALGERCSIP